MHVSIKWALLWSSLISSGYKSLPDIALRLKTFLGGGYNGQYSTFNLSSKLTLHRLDDVNHVEISVWSPPGLSKPTFAEAVRQTYRPTKKGETFGPPWSNHWFRVTLRIPPEWHECERVQLEWDASGEALVYSEDGQALQGASSMVWPLTSRYQRRQRPVRPQRVHHLA